MINDEIKIKYECTEKRIHTFITSRLDCNSLLYGVRDHHMRKLHRVMNASARFIFCAPKHCHITPLLKQLHWLPIRLRIEIKILLITFKVVQGSAPKYLIVLISVLPSSRYDLPRNNEELFWAPQSVSQSYHGRSILHGSSATALEQSSRKH